MRFSAVCRRAGLAQS